MRVPIALGLSLALVAGCPRSGQLPDPLSRPEGQLTCQRHLVAPAYAKRFEWRAGGRRIDVTYDSLGNPLMAHAFVEMGSRGHLMLARFDSSSATGMYGAASDSGPQTPRQMTPAETARARELAVWLWDRRCEGA